VDTRPLTKGVAEAHIAHDMHDRDAGPLAEAATLLRMWKGKMISRDGITLRARLAPAIIAGSRRLRLRRDRRVVGGKRGRPHVIASLAVMILFVALCRYRAEGRPKIGPALTKKKEKKRKGENRKKNRKNKKKKKVEWSE